jgi:alpha-beta hydrolase superfamily lysophospholipase
MALNIPVGDRTTFAELVQLIANFIETQRNPMALEPAAAATSTPLVYLLGESMGGLVALGVAQV